MKKITSFRDQDAPIRQGAACEEAQSYTLTDTDGDVIKFAVEDGRLVEYVNGSKCLEVTWLLHDPVNNRVRDAEGAFTLRPETASEDLEGISGIAAQTGVSVSTRAGAVPPREATVHVDVDLDAGPEQTAEEQRAAEEAVRRACSSLGRGAEAPLQVGNILNTKTLNPREGRRGPTPDGKFGHPLNISALSRLFVSASLSCRGPSRRVWEFPHAIDLNSM
jgi:hypothetical protein